MSAKKGGYNKNFKKERDSSNKNREIMLPDKNDDTHICCIEKKLGDLRYDLKFNTKTVRSEKLRKKFSRGSIINVGTYVLVQLREFNKNEIDIIFIYSDSEVNYLVDKKLIAKDASNTSIQNNDIFSNVVFSNCDVPQQILPMKKSTIITVNELDDLNESEESIEAFDINDI
jgi:initiation factor 1A